MNELGVKKVYQIPIGLTSVIVTIDNSTTGSFDFIRPQLYLLDGKEATIVGKPTSQLKAPKRVLYAKR